MNRIYCAIGKLVEVTQNIEMDILDVIYGSEIIKEFGRHQNKLTKQEFEQVVDDSKYLKDKMETMTFGQMISIVYESESLKRDEINELKALLEKRNYFTHEYFKCTKFGQNPSEEFILDEFEAIKEYLRKLKSMYSKLEIIKKGQNERIEFLKSKSGLNL